jgi:hypothetical protein
MPVRWDLHLQRYSRIIPPPRRFLSFNPHLDSVL